MKTFLIDTNVILYDPYCIYQFSDNHIIVPITVLEELDRFKKGNEVKNLNARIFIRELDKLAEFSEDSVLSLPDTGGKLEIVMKGFTIKHSSPIFKDSGTKVDNQLIALALNLQRERNNQVTFITKDINLRMKARAFDIKAQDYETDKIKDTNELPKGYRVIENVSADYIDKLHKNPHGIYIRYIEDPLPNEYYILKNGSKSVLARYNSKSNQIEKLVSNPVADIYPKNAEQYFAVDALTNPDITLVVLTGTAGSGKTLLSLASGIEKKSNYKKILVTRPVVPLGNDIGFLPGSISEKLDPYMQPLWDNLDIIKDTYKNPSKIDDIKKEEKLSVVPTPYLRGRSLPRVFFLGDESQQYTPHEIKTLLTRIGEGSKVVLTGDIHQIDSPYLDSRSNGLTYLINKMQGQDIFAHINLKKGERSQLAELASNVL